jgi:hypothetical protein
VLLVVELGLRRLGHIPADDVAGPTLATIGAVMVAALTSFRKPPDAIPGDVQRWVDSSDVVLEKRTGHRFRNISWTMTLAMIVVWAFAVVEAHLAEPHRWFNMRADYWLGGSNALVGFIMSEVKEALS